MTENLMSTRNTETVSKTDVAEHFTSIAHVYNERNYVQAGKRSKYPDIAIRHQYFLEMLVGTHGRVLEIGCGSGQMQLDLLRRGYEVVGIDIATGMIEATRKLVNEKLPNARPRLLVGDIEALAFPDAYFDVVLAAGVIEYLRSDEKSLREISRVLKPGGIVLLSVRNKLNLSRWITTSRDLLQSTPVIGKGMDAASNAVRALLSLPPNGGIPGKRHVPVQLKRALRQAGLKPTDHSFYHFAVFPRFLERHYGQLCANWAQRLERFRRSPLGYLANQYIVQATKI